jgi:hypothetical protein
MRKFLIMSIVKLRWLYFHINPMYIKFYMDIDHNEAHFQHKKTGQLYFVDTISSNFIWVDNQ